MAGFPLGGGAVNAFAVVLLDGAASAHPFIEVGRGGDAELAQDVLAVDGDEESDVVGDGDDGVLERSGMGDDRLHEVVELPIWVSEVWFLEPGFDGFQSIGEPAEPRLVDVEDIVVTGFASKIRVDFSEDFVERFHIPFDIDAGEFGKFLFYEELRGFGGRGVFAEDADFCAFEVFADFFQELVRTGVGERGRGV